jgi:hypothetical protein
MASSKPIQLSLPLDIALYSRGETSKGLTLSIWGENQRLRPLENLFLL